MVLQQLRAYTHKHEAGGWGEEKGDKEKQKETKRERKRVRERQRERQTERELEMVWAFETTLFPCPVIYLQQGYTS